MQKRGVVASLKLVDCVGIAVGEGVIGVLEALVTPVIVVYYISESGHASPHDRQFPVTLVIDLTGTGKYGGQYRGLTRIVNGAFVIEGRIAYEIEVRYGGSGYAKSALRLIFIGLTVQGVDLFRWQLIIYGVLSYLRYCLPRSAAPVAKPPTVP